MKPTRRYQEYRQCKSKETYYTTREANASIHKLRKHTQKPLTYYKCPICHKYHLTSSSKYKENFDGRNFNRDISTES